MGFFNMKIEKLNENKIRVILNIDDLAERDIDYHSFMSNSIESQSIFLDMLQNALELIILLSQKILIKNKNLYI